MKFWLYIKLWCCKVFKKDCSKVVQELINKHRGVKFGKGTYLFSKTLIVPPTAIFSNPPNKIIIKGERKKPGVIVYR